MPGVKTNEREGTRAVLRHSRMSAYKARQVLDLIRGQDVDRATEILRLGDREASATIGKVLASAVANAVHNDGLDAEDLYVSACYADEGGTLKRWRPRARGRATRIRKRTSHVTIIVSRMPDERIARRRAKAATSGAQRSRRVAGSRRRQAAEETPKRGAGTEAAEQVEPIEDEQVEPIEDEIEDQDEGSAEAAAEDDTGDATSDADKAADAAGGHGDAPEEEG